MPVHPQVRQFLDLLAQQRTPEPGTIPVDRIRLANELAPRPKLPLPAIEQVRDTIVETPNGPLAVRVYIPNRPSTLSRNGRTPATLYFHGGGWVINSVKTHDDLAHRLCAASQTIWISVEYRLAPEHPYPAATEDAWNTLNWLVANASELGIDPARVAVCGDSAGANLATALCLMTRDRKGPSIAFQALIYPVADCDFSRPSYIENAEGYLLTAAEMKWFWSLYCPEPTLMSQAYASPLRAETLKGLPPAFVMTAEYDPLRDEGEAYAHALSHAGVPVVMRRYPGMIHAFLRRVDQFDTAREAIEEIGLQLMRGLQ